MDTSSALAQSSGLACLWTSLSETLADKRTSLSETLADRIFRKEVMEPQSGTVVSGGKTPKQRTELTVLPQLWVGSPSAQPSQDRNGH